MRTLTFTSLQVRNLEVSKAFYVDKLGFELSEMSNPAACIFKYKQGEASFAIRTPINDFGDRETGIGVSLWFAIDEKIEELYDMLTEKQVAVLGAIAHTPFGKTLMVKDPDGYVITFLEPNSAVA